MRNVPLLWDNFANGATNSISCKLFVVSLPSAFLVNLHLSLCYSCGMTLAASKLLELIISIINEMIAKFMCSTMLRNGFMYPKSDFRVRIDNVFACMN